jgi:NAD(P)H-flavin reductase
MNYTKPQIAKIKKINKITNNLAIFNLSPGKLFTSGQFYMLSIPGFSEAPFTPTNYPNVSSIEFLIAKKDNGIFTTKLFSLNEQDQLFIRGPFGNGFDFSKMTKKNITLVAGGCGLAPLKSALDYIVKHQKQFLNIQLLYGVNYPQEFAYNKYLNNLKNKIEFIKTVVHPSKSYRGNTGYIDKLINHQVILSNTIALLCGPPQMYDMVIKKLLLCGLKPDEIYCQLERNMHCGIGLCQHCTCGDKYVCTDGPIFTYQELLKMNTKI